MFLTFMSFATFIFSWILTWALRRYALKIKLLDIPNNRSSHIIPTPRGAGLAIVISFFVGIFVLNQSGLLSTRLTLGLFCSGLGVAAFGFFDDLYNISARLRLSAHFIAAIIALYFLGGMPAITLLGVYVPVGIVANILAVFYLVWLLNLYNFMDGIDGLAGVEALFGCGSFILLCWITGHQGLMALPLLLAAAVAGFLYWNFPPARIFMGDVGSGFLGLIIGVLSIQSAAVNIQLFWGWLILLGVFIVDATLTLLRRAFNGEQFASAHRSHAYQHATQFYGSHLKVVLTVLAINFFWLLPLAFIAAMGYLDGFIALLIAYAPLIFIAFKLNAGKSSTFPMVENAVNKSI